MNVTRISLTVFAVQADSLSCTRPGCRFVTRSPAHRPGDSCPRCERNQVNVAGVLEFSTYQVDLEMFNQNSECGCQHFQMRIRPKLLRMTFEQRIKNRLRCKHCLAARNEAKKDENFDRLLASLPDQESQT